MAAKTPIILAIEHVRSSHNIGAMFRSSDGAGIEQIILSPLCPAPPRSDISKTALGAELTVPWQQPTDFLATLQKLTKQGYTLAALEQTPEASDLFTTPLPFPLILVVGHEREGISPEVLALASFHIQLPMLGTSAHSLNVSNATAISLYELGRRVWYHRDI